MRNSRVLIIFLINQFFFNIDLQTSCHDLYPTVAMDDNYFNNLPDNYYLQKKSNLYEKNNFIIREKNIKTVVFIAPVYVTGGMENLCQFADELKKQGLEVYMICIPLLHGFHTVPNNIIRKKNIDNIWYLCASEEDYIPLVYKEEYDLPFLNRDVPLDSSTLIVTHEGWIDYLPFFEDANKMICWLSIGNINCCNRSRTSTELINKKRLDLMDCFHTSQAPWVEKTLKSWGASVWTLDDYISFKYITIPKSIKRINTIAYNPAKGNNLAKLFMSKYTKYDYIKLQGLNFLGMINALDQAQIYIDFGDFPGKDRIPREAMLRDCVIFIHNAGCATDYDSFPIDEYFRFSDIDVVNGTLEEKINEALLNWNDFYNRQSIMRDALYQEYEDFKENVKEIVVKLNSKLF